MINPAGKTRPRKTIVVLSAALILLVVFALSLLIIPPAYERYELTHVKYPIYGGMTQELKESGLYKDMQSGKSFCFLGDSITAGTEIDGIPWYQPLVPYIKGDISNLSRGGWMVSHLIEKSDEIPSSDIYVIAIGINDVVRPDIDIAAKAPAEYTEKISRLADSIRRITPGAKIYFIAPWALAKRARPYEERGEQFRKALMEWCPENRCTGIDPNPFISSVLKESGEDEYMQDSLHPNTPKGIGLYCYAVLKADVKPTI